MPSSAEQRKLVCVVKLKRNFICLHCILAYLLTISTISTPTITITMYMSCQFETATIYIQTYM